MKKLNPKNYDFIWLVHNMTYFGNSFWLTPEVTYRDFIITSKGSEWKVYLGKKQREKLSEYGLRFFQTKFNEYQKEVNKEIKKAQKFFKTITKHRITFLSDRNLKVDFLKAVNITKKLWGLYFYTEYFLHDKVQEIIKKNDKNGKILAQKIRKMQVLKYNFRKVINQTVYQSNIFETYFLEISRRFHRDDFYSLHYNEIANLISGKKISEMNRINYVLGKFNNWQLITGQAALKIINLFDAAILQEAVSNRLELRGQIANKGTYRGRVKIIPFDVKSDINKKINEMKKGDVLVTGSTGPDMILACKKAGAIVTEEGGIASHAAIVSRELGIPCVIGTKIATQFLKNGDLVEVDAINGVVKKLNDGGVVQDINPKEWELEFQQRNSHPVIMSDFWCRALDQQLPKDIKLYNIQIDYLFTTYSKGYIKKHSKADLLKKMKKELDKAVYLKYIYDATINRVINFKNISRSISDKVKGKLIKSELSKLWKKFDQEFLKLIPWFYIPWYITEENYLSDVVKQDLVEHKAAVEKYTDMNNALMVLLFPMKDTLFQKEQDIYFKLVRQASQTKYFAANLNFKKQAERYLDQFSWMTTYLLLPLEKMNFDELVRRIKKDIRGKALEQYELQRKARNANAELAKKLMDTLANDKKLISEIEWSQKYAWLLTWSVEQSLVITANLLEFFKLIAKAIKIPYKKWVFLTSEEIRNILDGEIVISDINLKAREQAHCILLQSGNIQLFVDKKAKEISDFIENNVGKIDDSVKTFKGQSVYPGKVKGKVVIANNAQEASRLKKGEILVTSMTTPDFVPVMKKAVAIVVNEGGLLSHAAIISREFKIPCIVGTKIATKVLKDGDLVEVDANQGVVRKIK